MAGELDETNGEVQQLEHDDAGNDDFDAGYGKEKDVTATPQPDPNPDTATDVQPPAPAPAPPKYAQITEEQLSKLMSASTEYETYKADMTKQLDRVNGSIGNFKQRLDGLGSGDVSAEDFEALKDEFPDLVEPMLKGFKKAAGRVRTAAPGSDVNQLVDTKVAETRSELIDTTLDSVMDGDWRAEVNTPKFQAWAEAQTADIKALAQSTNLREASRYLRMFKAHRDAPAARAPAPSPQPANGRQRQVSAAVNPRSAGGFTPPAQTEDDDFDKGYKGQPP